MKKILIACEESQAITKEFRSLGYEAFSCDLLPCSGGHPEWHIQGDVFEVIDQGWDLMIAHPPCTYLSQSGTQWYYHPEDKHLPIDQRRPHPRYPNRESDRQNAIEFVIKLYESSVPRIAIENPIGSLSTAWRKPNQIVQPWMFGDEANKGTCLWLKNLPLLTPTDIVGKGEFFEFTDKNGKLKRQPMWYYKALSQAKTPAERRTLRSKTFQGMAKAIANQWSKVL
jgi:hypothetical protein